MTTGQWNDDQGHNLYVNARPTVYSSNMNNYSSQKLPLFVGKRFRQAAKLDGRKKYECNICGAVFGTRGGRYYHMASHNGKFKYT